MSKVQMSSLDWRAALQHRTQSSPAATALCAAGRPALDYQSLVGQIDRIGLQLRQLGIARSTRVALLLPPGVESAGALLSVMSHAVCVPLNPASAPAELSKTLRACGAQAVIVAGPDAAALRPLATSLGLIVLTLQVQPDAPAGTFALKRHDSLSSSALPAPTEDETTLPDHAALVLHTSGTTAEPKRVVLTHAQLGASAHNIAAHLRLQPNDRSLNVMPLFHSHGIVGVLLSSLVSGGSVVCMQSFDPLAFCAAVAEFAPSWYSASPTIHCSVLEHRAQLREQAPRQRFRFVRSTSAALPAAVLERLEQALGAPVIESFGMTEWSQMASNALPPARRKPGCVGQATGVELALRQADGSICELSGVHDETLEGELLVRGVGVAQGYEGDPQATARAWIDGWFHTGDLAAVEADGHLRISGRLKDVINRGGEKISPLEIEAALMRHPAVRDAVAFGVPHPTLGEDLAAAVVLIDGESGETVDEGALRDHLFAYLADFKVPSTVVLTDEIPRSATGKIQRRELAQRLRIGASSSVAVPEPQSPIERDLLAVFAGVLGRQDIAPDANFFLLGGDSLSGMRVISRINKQLGIKLPPATLFRHPSIRELAAQIEPKLGRSAAGIPGDASLVARQVAALSDAEVHRLLALEEASAARRAA